ncbi:extracellular solute-binding protein [Alloiococcus sp. CFN-8]|uniref:extracellular solute-binding protein n=1 Tax=Alloiococcus sp. CFN-8 TaxID=3416081 RepID=UPI003CF7331E
MKRRLLSVLMVAMLSVGVLAGCQGESKPKDNGAGTDGEVKEVELKVWAPENQVQSGTIESMTKSFQEEHPEWKITFTVEAVGEDVAKDQILKDPEAAADVYFFANDQLSGLIDAGAIAKLGGSTEEMVKSTMDETVVNTVTHDGSIYGIPFTHNTFFMYYDKTLIPEDSIGSVEKIVQAATANDVYNFVFDSAGGWKLGAWYYGAGLSIYGEDGNDYAKGSDWNSEKGLAVTNYLVDLINNPKVAYNDDVSLSELTAAHRVGAWFDGSWNYNLYKDALGDDLGVAVLPTFNPDGTDYQLKAFYGSKVIGVNSNSKNPEVAVALAAYLGSEEMQVKRYEETNQVPTNKTAGSSDAVKADEVATAIIGVVEKASIMQPTSSEFGNKYWTNAGAIATEIRNGELTKANAQERLDKFVDNMKVE